MTDKLALEFIVIVLPAVLLAGFVTFLNRRRFQRGVLQSVVAAGMSIFLAAAIGAGITWITLQVANNEVAACEEALRNGAMLYDCEDAGLFVAYPFLSSVLAFVISLLVGVALTLRAFLRRRRS
ncbi:MAG: hypothetical protein AAGB02_06520 [Pseudomonadota bacterium]